MKGSLLVTVVAGGALLAGPGAVTVDRPVCADRCALVAAVAEALAEAGTATDGRAPLVEPQRWSTNGMWAFGAAAVLPQGSPVPTLFLAEQIRHRWTVSLLATAGFAAAVNDAPKTLLGGGRKGDSDRQRRGGDPAG